MKRGNHSKSRGSKALVLILAFILIMGAAIGTTLAYLTDDDTITNTFTVGNIDIDLEETTTEYKMIPGQPIDKDPVVTVVGGSEDCWLFVKLTEAITPQTTDGSYNGTKSFDDYLTYTMAVDGEGNAIWTALPGHDGVYYREITSATADQEFAVLGGDQVTVLPGVTKGMMDHLTENAANPTLTVTAYAIQRAGFDVVDDAWHEVSGEAPHSETP